MTKEDIKYQAYIQILKEELIPAMGCTEPIALAYAAAMNNFLRSSENKLPVWDKRQGK